MLTSKIIPRTKISTEISLKTEGIITIKGRSFSGEVKQLPADVEIWLEEYLSNPAHITRIEIRLEYIGGFTSGYYVEIVKKIRTVYAMGKKLVVNWYYEEGDEDILEKGECISMYLDLPFNFIMISDPSLAK